MVSVVHKSVWFWCAWLALYINLCGFGAVGVFYVVHSFPSTLLRNLCPKTTTKQQQGTNNSQMTCFCALGTTLVTSHQEKGEEEGQQQPQ